MDIEGATDVITFDHGEIIVSIETAILNAEKYNHTWQRELFLYMIHGLLHLVGHDDLSEQDRLEMEQIQFSIMDELWPSTFVIEN